MGDESDESINQDNVMRAGRRETDEVDGDFIGIVKHIERNN